MKKTEAEIIKEAYQSNYMWYGGFETEILHRPTDGCIDKMICCVGYEEFVPPSDLFIIIATWNCGVATSGAVTAMLHKMHEENPEKSILNYTLEEEARTSAIRSRIRNLSKNNLFLEVVVKDSKPGSERRVMTYMPSEMAVRFAITNTESLMSKRSDVLNVWGNDKEFLRRLLVSRFINYNFYSSCIKHFRRYSKLPKIGGGYNIYQYLWFSSVKDGKTYSVMVQPFVLKRDERINNEEESYINNVMAPLKKLHDFLLFSESTEQLGALVLIVDKEEDLNPLSMYVKKYIPEERFYERILLTSNGLLGTQQLDTMYFGLNGLLVPSEKRMF